MLRFKIQITRLNQRAPLFSMQAVIPVARNESGKTGAKTPASSARRPDRFVPMFGAIYGCHRLASGLGQREGDLSKGIVPDHLVTFLEGLAKSKV